jgi:hypothetical protein
MNGYTSRKKRENTIRFGVVQPKMAKSATILPGSIHDLADLMADLIGGLGRSPTPEK